MKLKLLFSIVFTLSFALQAQLKISGQILDKGNESLPYVNVYLTNTTNGTVTDFNGRFQ